jgi:Effector Associated Constant Component 1
MDAHIRIVGATSEDWSALRHWLDDEPELRGKIRTIRSPIGETELGSVTEVLDVALGAGGAGTVLASSLITWLKTRRTTAKITVEAADRMVTLDIKTIHDVTPLLKQILRPSDD